MKITFILVVLCLASVAWCQDTEEGAKPRSLGLLRRGALAKSPGKATSTTTTPAPKEEVVEEYDDEEGAVEEDIVEEEPEPTSTEASKKLKAGVVRPFRSNDELLAALKRRRAEAANGKVHLHEQAPSTKAPEQSADNSIANKNNLSGRRRFNSVQKNEKNEAPAEESTPAPVKSSRNRFSGRGLYKSNAALTDNPEITGLESKQRAVEVKPRSSYRRFQ